MHVLDSQLRVQECNQTEQRYVDSNLYTRMSEIQEKKNLIFLAGKMLDFTWLGLRGQGSKVNRDPEIPKKIFSGFGIWEIPRDSGSGSGFAHPNCCSPQ